VIAAARRTAASLAEVAVTIARAALGARADQS
jgi:hypothetical protein